VQQVRQPALRQAVSFEIKEVSFSEVSPFRRDAAAARVSLKDLEGARWFAAYQAGVIVGVAGLTVSGSRAKMRGLYVSPACRRQGIAAALTERRLVECRGKVAAVEAFAYNPRHYLRRGFRAVGKPTSAGATRVCLVLAVRAKVIAVRRSALPLGAGPHLRPGSG
jgi:N-acetylglutamate synthase-like GNAT family acetyltransferase